MGVAQELTNGLEGVGHVFSFMLKQKKSLPPPPPPPPSTEGTFAKDPHPNRISIPGGACHTPNPLELLLLFNLAGYPL